jgi:hypothetical protein
MAMLRAHRPRRAAPAMTQLNAQHTHIEPRAFLFLKKYMKTFSLCVCARASFLLRGVCCCVLYHGHLPYLPC